MREKEGVRDGERKLGSDGRAKCLIERVNQLPKEDMLYQAAVVINPFHPVCLLY